MPVAAPTLGNVLTESHYNEINRGLRSLAAGRRLIEMARNAGINVDEYENAYNLVESRLTGLKREFFPDRP